MSTSVKNVGRANFLVLYTLDETNGMGSIQTSKNVPHPVGLVKPTQFLVVQDLAQAYCIAFVWGVGGELLVSRESSTSKTSRRKILTAEAVAPDVLRKYSRSAKLRPSSWQRRRKSFGQLKQSWGRGEV